MRFGYRWIITLWKATVGLNTRQEYRRKGQKTLQPWALMSLNFQVFLSLSTNQHKKYIMPRYPVLYISLNPRCKVQNKKNPVQKERSALSVQGLEKPLGGMEGKRQGLSYFLSFFLFSPSFQRRIGGRGALSSSECSSRPCWEGSNDKRTQETLVFWCNRLTRPRKMCLSCLSSLPVGMFGCFLALSCASRKRHISINPQPLTKSIQLD